MTPIPVLRVEPGVKFDRVAPAGARIIGAVDGATKVLGFDLWISAAEPHFHIQAPKGTVYPPPDPVDGLDV